LWTQSQQAVSWTFTAINNFLLKEVVMVPELKDARVGMRLAIFRVGQPIS